MICTALSYLYEVECLFPIDPLAWDRHYKRTNTKVSLFFLGLIQRNAKLKIEAYIVYSILFPLLCSRKSLLSTGMVE